MKGSVSMFDALKDIMCFVTAFVCFLYGTRIAWVCGKKCQFSQKPEIRYQSLFSNIPAAAMIYFFGFLIAFSYCFDAFLAKLVFSVTSAVLLSNLVVSMAMPELRRKPSIEIRVLAELADGNLCKMSRQELNTALDNGHIVRFQRSDGWVQVGRDPLRKMHRKSASIGVERRLFALNF
jgi:hypothetical protein